MVGSTIGNIENTVSGAVGSVSRALSRAASGVLLPSNAARSKGMQPMSQPTTVNARILTNANTALRRSLVTALKNSSS